MEPHSTALRERVIHAYESGEGSQRELAVRFSLSRSTIQNWLNRKHQTGSLEPSERGGGNHSPVDMEILDQVVAERPDSTSRELAVAYNKKVKRRLRVHRSSILRALHRAGYVFKKKEFVRSSESDQTSSRSGASLRTG